MIYRDRTGEGQSLDISMTDCSLPLNALTAPGYFNGGINPEPERTVLNGGTFYGFYQTKDGRHFSVGSLEPQFRKLLCEAIGQGDKYHMSLSQDPKDIEGFKEIVREAFLSKTFDEWGIIFADVEACVEPVLTFAEVAEHPLTKERGMIVKVPKLGGGFQKQIACPIKSSVFTPVYKHVGLNPGDSNSEVLGESYKVKS